jgi:hypothetical protein
MMAIMEKAMVNKQIEVTPESESIIKKTFSCENHEFDHSSHSGVQKRRDRWAIKKIEHEVSPRRQEAP